MQSLYLGRCRRKHAAGRRGTSPPRVSRQSAVLLQTSPSEERGGQGEAAALPPRRPPTTPLRAVLVLSAGGATRVCLCDWPRTFSQATPTLRQGRRVASSGGGARFSCLCDWPGASGRCDDRATGGNRLCDPTRKALHGAGCTSYPGSKSRDDSQPASPCSVGTAAPCRLRRRLRAAAAADADEPPQPRRVSPLIFRFPPRVCSCSTVECPGASEPGAWLTGLGR